MKKKAWSSPNAPAAIGPYEQAVSFGDWVFCSGQIPLDPGSGALVGEGDIAAQVHQVFRNLDAVLAAAGACRESVVKANVYLTDMANFSIVNEIYSAYFEGLVPPARATVAVAALPKDAWVEIDFIAARTDR